VGLAAANLIPADVGISSEVIVPPTVRIGAAYQWQLPQISLDLLRLSLEETYRQDRWETKFGAEAWLIKQSLGVRAGVNPTQLSSGLSYALSVPGRPLALQLDYAFNYPWFVQGTWGSHRVGLNLQWQQPRTEAGPTREERLLIAYQKAIRSELLESPSESVSKWQEILNQEPENPGIQKRIDWLKVPRYKQAGSTQQTEALDRSLKTLKMVSTRKVPGLDPKTETFPLQISRFQLQMDKTDTYALDEYLQERLGIAEALAAEGKSAQALRELENIRAIRPEWEVVEQKIRHIQQAVRTEIGGAFAKGMMHLRYKRYLEAMRQFEMILSVDPDYQPASAKLIMVKNLIAEQFQKKFKQGQAHYEQGKYDQAWACFQQIQSEWPHYPNLQTYLDHTRDKQKLVETLPEEMARAQEELNRKNIGPALERLAFLLRSNVGKADSATQEAVAKRAQALRYDHLGQLALLREQREAAQGWWHKSLALDAEGEMKSKLINLHLRTGMQDFRRQAYRKALVHWQAILKLSPNHTVVKQYSRKTQEKLKQH